MTNAMPSTSSRLTSAPPATAAVIAEATARAERALNDQATLSTPLQLLNFVADLTQQKIDPEMANNFEPAFNVIATLDKQAGISQSELALFVLTVDAKDGKLDGNYNTTFLSNLLGSPQKLTEAMVQTNAVLSGQAPPQEREVRQAAPPTETAAKQNQRQPTQQQPPKQNQFLAMVKIMMPTVMRTIGLPDGMTRAAEGLFSVVSGERKLSGGDFSNMIQGLMSTIKLPGVVQIGISSLLGLFSSKQDIMAWFDKLFNKRQAPIESSTTT
jgi:hypothetical protein